MPLKNKLNQYELDTALAVLRDKRLPLSGLQQKTVAVSGGGDLHRAIVYSLLHLNEEKQLNMKVVSVGERIPTLYEDDDFAVKELAELESVDFFIESGFLRYTDADDTDGFSSCIDRAMRVTSALAQVKLQRVILLSSSAVRVASVSYSHSSFPASVCLASLSMKRITNCSLSENASGE